MHMDLALTPPKNLYFFCALEGVYMCMNVVLKQKEGHMSTYLVAGDLGPSNDLTKLEDESSIWDELPHKNITLWWSVGHPASIVITRNPVQRTSLLCGLYNNN